MSAGFELGSPAWRAPTVPWFNEACSFWLGDVMKKGLMLSAAIFTALISIGTTAAQDGTDNQYRPIRPQDHQRFLGGRLSGTRSVAAFSNSTDTSVTCGLAFSHGLYDDDDSNGALVRIVGRATVTAGVVSEQSDVIYRNGVLRVSGVDYGFLVNAAGDDVRVEQTPFEIQDAYLTVDGEPIGQWANCSGPEYCRYHDDWSTFLTEFAGGDFYLGYRRADGEADVMIRINTREAEGGTDEHTKLGECFRNVERYFYAAPQHAHPDD